MRSTAFVKLYKMSTLLHRSKLNILAKEICLKIQQLFLVQIQLNFANVAKSARTDGEHHRRLARSAVELHDALAREGRPEAEGDAGEAVA